MTSLAATVAVVLLAAAGPSPAYDRGNDEPCASSILEDGKAEARKKTDPQEMEPNLRAALDRISRGIAALEGLAGRGGQLCRVQLAEAYVYLAACVWRVEAVWPNKEDEEDNKGLSPDGFQQLQRHAVPLALEHAVLLDPPTARATLATLEKAGVIDDNLSDMFRQAVVFVQGVAPAAVKATAKAGLPKWVILALGGFVAKQPHRGDAPMFGPYVFSGIGSRRGLSAGPIVGWSLGGGSTAVVGFGVHLGATPRAGITAGLGWRLPSRTGERTLSGFGVGGAYRFGGS